MELLQFPQHADAFQVGLVGLWPGRRGLGVRGRAPTGILSVVQLQPCLGALDGDGQLELYVAAYNQRELKKYVWNADRKTFDKTLLGRIDANVITWNITTATL